MNPGKTDAAPASIRDRFDLLTSPRPECGRARSAHFEPSRAAVLSPHRISSGDQFLLPQEALPPLRRIGRRLAPVTRNAGEVSWLEKRSAKFCAGFPCRQVLARWNADSDGSRWGDTLSPFVYNRWKTRLSSGWMPLPKRVPSRPAARPSFHATVYAPFGKCLLEFATRQRFYCCGVELIWLPTCRAPIFPRPRSCARTRPPHGHRAYESPRPCTAIVGSDEYLPGTQGARSSVTPNAAMVRRSAMHSRFSQPPAAQNALGCPAGGREPAADVHCTLIRAVVLGRRSTGTPRPLKIVPHIAAGPLLALPRIDGKVPPGQYLTDEVSKDLCPLCPPTASEGTRKSLCQIFSAARLREVPPPGTGPPGKVGIRRPRASVKRGSRNR